jgi:hypothetical protein
LAFRLFFRLFYSSEESFEAFVSSALKSLGAIVFAELLRMFAVLEEVSKLVFVQMTHHAVYLLEYVLGLVVDFAVSVTQILFV